MTRVYEGMFVLDNQLVREDWKAAKAVVTSALEKHGGKVHTARRWDERRLAYPIANHQRGTYLLAYFDIPGDGLPVLTRDLELSEPVLRHLILQAVAVPETEVELSKAEEAADFEVPAPPADDAVEEEEAPDRDHRRRDDRGRDDRGRDDRDDRRRGSAPAGAAKPAEAKADEAKAGEAKAGEAKAGEAKAGEAKADEAKADEAKADEAKAGEAKAEEAKPAEAKADEAKAETTTVEAEGPAKEA